MHTSVTMLLLAGILKVNQSLILWPDHICSVLFLSIRKAECVVDTCLYIAKRDDVQTFIR